MVAVLRYVLLAIGVGMTTASIIERATPTVILNDLQQCNTDCQALQTAIANYDGTIAKLATIQQRTNVFLSDIKQLNTDIVNSPQFADRDAKTLIEYINTVLEPCLDNLCSEYIKAKPKFQQGGFAMYPRQAISYLRGNFSTALGSVVIKSSASYKAAASSASSKVTADFDRALSSYA